LNKNEEISIDGQKKSITLRGITVSLHFYTSYSTLGGGEERGSEI